MWFLVKRNKFLYIFDGFPQKKKKLKNYFDVKTLKDNKNFKVVNIFLRVKEKKNVFKLKRVE
jgi:hypothetical protein